MNMRIITIYEKPSTPISFQIVFSLLTSGIFLWLIYNTEEKDFTNMQSVFSIVLPLIPCAFISIYKQIPNILKKHSRIIWVIFFIITMVIVMDLYNAIGVKIETLLKN